MPMNMTLNSPWDYSALDQETKSLRKSQEYVTRFYFKEYLEFFSRKYGLQVHLNKNVYKIDWDKNCGFRIYLKDGDVVGCKMLVNATGYFSNPIVPNYPGHKNVLHIHSSEYRDPNTLAARVGVSKRVLVIGKRITAEQIADELYESGWDVSISCRGKITYAKLTLATKIKNYIYLRLESFCLVINSEKKKNSFPPMTGKKIKKRIDNGDIPLYPCIECIEDKSVRFSNGESREFDAVIYATGFNYSLQHMNIAFYEDKGSVHPSIMGNGVQSSVVPNLYFVGVDNQINFRSRYLRGIRKDAVTVAAHIQRNLLNR